MIAEWKSALSRAAPGLVADAAGALALFAMLVIGLSLSPLV